MGGRAEEDAPGFGNGVERRMIESVRSSMAFVAEALKPRVSEQRERNPR